MDLYNALGSIYDEVCPEDFYRDIFPAGSFEEKGKYEKGKYNGIAVTIGKGKKQTKRYTVTDDLDVISEIISSEDFCIMSPISYVGKSRKSENARFLYALAIDLDGVDTLKEWDCLQEQINNGHNMLAFVWGLPVPTYIVASGTGLHLYFVFEKPIPLFDNIVEQLKVLKKRLTWQAWTQGASTLHDKIQYESLFQAFRMVGSITKNGKRAKAYKVGDKVTIEYLNKYIPEEYQTTDFTYKSDLHLKEAKELYPEWYEKRIVKKQPKNTWQCKEDLYYWWIRKLKAGADQGHRYWCIFTLCTYAKKCGIDRERLEKDAFGLIPFMNTLGDEFTEDDVLAALQAYDDNYITYPIDSIIEKTGIYIERNRRNGRKQADHLKRARAVQDIDYPNGSWREGNGRKPKRDIVYQWRKEHPQGTKAQCERATKLSRHTIIKWWKYEPEMTSAEINHMNRMLKYYEKFTELS